jgi:hypothetical protein
MATSTNLIVTASERGGGGSPCHRHLGWHHGLTRRFAPVPEINEGGAVAAPPPVSPRESDVGGSRVLYGCSYIRRHEVFVWHDCECAWVHVDVSFCNVFFRIRDLFH